MNLSSSVPRLLVADLDGTLTRSDNRIAPAVRDSLVRLGERGIVRAIATGRHLFSARKVIPPDFPIDYLIFSTGAGIVEWPSQSLLSAQGLTHEESGWVVATLLGQGVDFMAHFPIPDNHHFLYWATGRENPDFTHRVHREPELARPLNPGQAIENTSQFLIIDTQASGDGGGVALYERIRSALPGLSVVRVTSPFDHRSLWVEILPSAVSKASAAAWVAKRHGLGPEQVAAVGNDYNDDDLLTWARFPYVVGNAPPSLRSRFAVVASNERDGFCEMVEKAFGVL